MARRPDFNVCVKPKEGKGVNTKVGAAWQDDQGRISIALHPCVVLSARDEVWISLYPVENHRSGRVYPNQQNQGQDSFDYGPPPMSDDDVPF